jgi:hypothetical protein
VGARSNADEPIIHDMIEVLPEQREEAGSESESEENEIEEEFGKEDGEEYRKIDDEDDETILRDATVKPEILEPPHPSHQPPQLPQSADPE